MFCSCCETEDANIMHTVDSVAVAAPPPSGDDPDEDALVEVQDKALEPILPLVAESSEIVAQPSVDSGISGSKPPKEAEPIQAADSTKSEVKSAVEVASTQPPEDADTLPSTDFIINLDRSNGEKLGLVAYNNSGENFMRIRAIKSTGLVASWNQAKRIEQQVMVDYAIMSVNGMDNPTEMKRIITDNTVSSITMVVRRTADCQ
mmetsp:Transcript_71317/g.133398  ORF Transcript_71317/g.133398 Transcript_71317/m.133398 type:complete len:204 (-) Transcript_71317:87-698(-)